MLKKSPKTRQNISKPGEAAGGLLFPVMTKLILGFNL